MNTPDHHRRTQFNRWWKRNHNKSVAHTWLCHNTQNWCVVYQSAPEIQHQVAKICNRFFSSDYRKLSAPDAYRLWRWCHPGVQHRTAQLNNNTTDWLENFKHARAIRKAQATASEPVPATTVKYKPKRKLIIS